MAIPQYSFYTDTYFGASIPRSEWDRIAGRADEQLSYFERTYTVTDPTTDGSGRDKAVCAIADEMYTREMIGAAELFVDSDGSIAATSISIGSVSTSVKAPSTSNLGIDMTEGGAVKAYYNAALRYLEIYRGVRGRGC